MVARVGAEDMRRLLLSVVLAAIAALSGIVGFGLLAELLNESRDNATEVYLFVGLPSVGISVVAIVGIVNLWRR